MGPRHRWRCNDGFVALAAPAHSTRRPQIIAHRGSSRAEPEHTLKAYQRAIAEGADGLECDVRLTADSHLVCVHDRRVNRTSNGEGLVSTLELATLEGLDWGSWKKQYDPGDTQTELPDRDRKKLLTLRQLLTMVTDCGREVGLAIETKHPTRYAGLVERRLAQLLHEFDLDRPYRPGRPYVRVMSFSQLANARMRQLAPMVPRVYLIEDAIPLLYRDGSLPRGVHIAGLDVRIVRRWPKAVSRLHAHGNQAYVYTVDDEPDVELCLRLGVDAIITNRPSFVRDLSHAEG